MDQLQQIKQWFNSLPSKEQMMVSGTAALIVITLFYLVIWEPIHVSLNAEQQKQQSQKEVLMWMQNAAVEVKDLRSSGGVTIRDKNKPATLVIEQTIKNSGLKSFIKKIESSGKNGARVTLKDAPFNQIIVWLNTLAKHNAIQVVSANIERADKTGKANARLTLERTQ